MAFSHELSPLQSIHYPTITPRKGQNNLTQTQKIDMEIQFQWKPRVLCLHGFRTSAEILRKQIQRWPEPVLRKLDLVFIDAPFPARGRSGIESLFDPPYYEWFQSSKVKYFDFLINFSSIRAWIHHPNTALKVLWMVLLVLVYLSHVMQFPKPVVFCRVLQSTTILMNVLLTLKIIWWSMDLLMVCWVFPRWVLFKVNLIWICALNSSSVFFQEGLAKLLRT